MAREMTDEPRKHHQFNTHGRNHGTAKRDVRMRIVGTTEPTLRRRLDARTGHAMSLPASQGRSGQAGSPPVGTIEYKRSHGTRAKQGDSRSHRPTCQCRRRCCFASSFDFGRCCFGFINKLTDAM